MSAGRPTRYRKEFAEQARKMCLLGATDKDLATFFEVKEQTINNWKSAHPEFFESLKKGKDLADAQVAERLFQRAMGFEHDSEEIKVLTTAKGSKIERVKIVKVYPPDTVAAIFWLKNRQKRVWRDKHEHGVTDNEGNDLLKNLPNMPDDLRQQLITFLEAQQQSAQGTEGTDGQ